MNAFDEHMAAIAAAQQQVAELQAGLNAAIVTSETIIREAAAAVSQAETALGAVAGAVGDSPRNTDAAAAMAMMADLKNGIEQTHGLLTGAGSALNEHLNMAEAVYQSLDSYSGVF